MLLSQYRTQLRRLLNDAQQNYWTDAELNDYINDGREQLALDTLCCRSFQTGNLVTGQEQYEYTDPGVALPQGNQIIDIVNITVIWGQGTTGTRYPLGYLDFTRFSALFRQWQNYQRIPSCFTIYNASQYWVGYIPDQNYATEFDTAILPLRLANDNSPDSIPRHYDQAVKFYAAYLARYKLQQYAEAAKMEQEYMKQIARLGAMPPRRIPYVYENEVF